MKALLLAAGLGTRLRPLTNNIAKCLVPINGKPLLEYWLSMLVNADVYPILINLHHFAGQVRDYLAKSEFSSFVTTVYEDMLLGTAGTLLKNRNFFEDGPVMLVHVDNLSKFDVKAFIERHRNRPLGCEITMMTFVTHTPHSCGIVELDARGIVQAFHEKVPNPAGNLANGAVYILESSVFDFLVGLDKEIIDFSTEVLPSYIGRIHTFHNDVYHRDIGTIESYEAANREFHQSNPEASRQVPKIQSAHAILILDGRYILQLRENKPTIAAPGQWALFGGKMKIGETPLETVRREVCEELSIESAEYSYLWYTDYFSPFEGTVIRSWFFASDVMTVWPGWKLREGKAVRAFQFGQLGGLDMPHVIYQTLERFHQQRGKLTSKR